MGARLKAKATQVSTQVVSEACLLWMLVAKNTAKTIEKLKNTKSVEAENAKRTVVERDNWNWLKSI